MRTDLNFLPKCEFLKAIFEVVVCTSNHLRQKSQEKNWTKQSTKLKMKIRCEKKYPLSIYKSSETCYRRKKRNRDIWVREITGEPSVTSL